MEHRTWQARGYTTRRGYERFDFQLRQTRRLYNAAREHRIAAYFRPGYNGGPRAKPGRVTLYSQFRDLTELRQADPEWAAVAVQVGRGALVRCDRAFKRFFADRKAGRTTGYPKHKDTGHWRTIEVENCSPNMVRVSPDGTRAKVTIKGLPTIKVKVRRPLPDSASLKKIALTREGRRLTANLTYEVDTPAPPPPLIEAAGIDMGVTERIVASDGYVVEGLNDSQYRRRLRVLQRRAEKHKRKGSRGQRKARQAVARHKRRERVRRYNEAHRITTELIKRYGFIVYEALRIVNMTASAKGTIEQPGKNVRAKQVRNRNILSQRWGIIRDMLEYKGRANGRTLFAVNPAYTSQACSRCDHIDASARRDKWYICSNCGLVIDSDLNASRTILMRGQIALGRPIDRLWDAQEGGSAATSGALAPLVPEIRTGTPAAALIEPMPEPVTAQSGSRSRRD